MTDSVATNRIYADPMSELPSVTFPEARDEVREREDDLLKQE